MAELNTVTIPIDEYFDLREKASMNGFLMSELGEVRTRLYEIERRLCELEQESER